MDPAAEYWLCGPVPEIPGLLQPVAHALLQSKREITAIMHGFPETALWLKPQGVASVGFHLLHLRGVLDRLFSYADNQSLNREQLAYLDAETRAASESPRQLTQAFFQQVDQCISRLRATDPENLTDPRTVGRKQLPTTRIGLYVHAAEHTMRHTGQLLVTARVSAAMISAA